MISKREKAEFPDELRRYQKYFISSLVGGVLIVLPVAILFMVVRFIVGLTTSIIPPVSDMFNLSPDFAPWIADLLNILIAVLVFFLIGVVSRTELGKESFKHFEESFLIPLPLYATVRDTIQQFTNQKKMPFRQVVLIDIYDNGVLQTGFVTDEMEGDIYTIYVPTAPNPTNGMVFHVPGRKIQFLDAKPEDAMRSIISVGTGSSLLFKPKDIL